MKKTVAALAISLMASGAAVAGDAAAGQAAFGSCVGCHGMDGKGMQMLGAANLADAVWRFTPANEESVKYTIAYGVNAPGATETRNAVMPAFGNQLSETDIKKLAVYVHQLGGGQ